MTSIVVAHTRAELGTALAELPRPRAVVMTMGALHEGHLNLVRLARARAQTVVVTIFVNPLQFGPGEDFMEYPRTLESDIAALDGLADVVFAPNSGEVYPNDEPEVLINAGRMGEMWEGVSRPGHFDGVLTVVAKFLHMTQPDIAVFGEKDAQQLALIQRMVADLDFPVDIVGAPTARSPEGLALSSRNAYLDEVERAQAHSLWTAICAARENVTRGADAVRDAALAVLTDTEGIELDYLALVDVLTLKEVEPDHRGEALLLIAAKVGTTRLIDNALLTLGAS